MSCWRARRRLLGYVFDDLERSERSLIESHLDGCPRCRRRALGLRRLYRALPEPHPAALEPPEEVWERTWSGILERIALPAHPEAAPLPRRTFFWRRAAAAAALCGAFVLGRHWESLSGEALSLAGLRTPSGGYFSGLDSFQAASHDYLQRSRLLLIELQQTGSGEAAHDDPWLVDHSRGLLGEVPHHLTAARRIHNPHLEDLLGELEAVLRQVLERSASDRTHVPPGLEAQMSLLLFKLEMLGRPSYAPAQAALHPTPL